MDSFWTLSLWPLSAMVLAGLFFSTWRMVLSIRRALRSRSPSVPLSSVLPPPRTARSADADLAANNGVLKGISFDEFKTLLRSFSDLIVIDLREEARRVPFPVSVEFVFPIGSYELVEVLELVPADRVVVFYGLSDLSLVLIETSSFIERPAPSYVLDADVPFLEVA